MKLSANPVLFMQSEEAADIGSEEAELHTEFLCMK